jgi:hypothetical protein
VSGCDRRQAGIRVTAAKEGGSAARPVDRRFQHHADRFEQVGAQQRAVEALAAFKKTLDPEFTLKHLEQREAEFGRTGEDIADAVRAQPGKVRTRNGLGQDEHNRLPADLHVAPGDLAFRIQHDGIGPLP